MAQTKRKTSSKKRTASSRRRSASSRKITQKRRAQLNQRWALFMFVPTLLTLLSLFRAEGTLLRPLGDILSGAVGVGFLVLPFAFVFAAVLLMMSRGRPVKWRIVCTFLIPFFVGAVAQAFVGSDEYVWDEVVAAGQILRGGGVLAGYPTILLVRWISRIGTIIFTVLALIFVILVAFDITISTAFESLKKFFSGMRKEVEYEEYEEEDEIEKKPEIRLPRRRRPIIDIPLDDITDTEQEKKEKKPGLELAPANVISPAEAVGGAADEEDEKDEKTNEEELINAENFAAEIFENIEKEQPKENDSRFVVPDNEERTAGEYVFPPTSILNAPNAQIKSGATEELRHIGTKLAETTKSFGVEIRIVNIVRGPSVTRFEVQLDAGVKLAKITALSEDIALALGSSGVFIAPVPGKSLIGIEIPNKTVQAVNMSEVVLSDEFKKNDSKVAFALGKDISGNCILCDIAKLPHMLIAGTTGSGKSVCINSIIVSILYRATPDEVRLIMIDPKMVELGVYNGIPHLLVPVVTDPKKAAGALQWAVCEMMNRYKKFSELGVRDMKAYNKAVADSPDEKPLPQIVIVIDELSDLMVVARKEVEDSIMRLSQMARAAGMHLIIATQRPSVDVITGVIKSNIPSRIAFAVASKIESNIILGSTGAEKLIGKGDMLYEPMGASKPTRVQGCFISSDEVEEVVAFIKNSNKAEYSDDIMKEIEKQAEKNEGGDQGIFAADEDSDDMLESAIDIAVDAGQISTSLLQRRLKLGYSRAARIIDQMEERGIISEFDGSKPRKALISREEWQEMKMRREDR